MDNIIVEKAMARAIPMVIKVVLPYLRRKVLRVFIMESFVNVC
jgi:hypothetical protein